MIVEQGGHELQQMFGRPIDALQITHSLRMVDIFVEQVDESGY